MERFIDGFFDTIGWFFESLLGMLVVALGVFAGFIWLLNITVMPHYCETKANLYELEHHYSFFTGCNVLVDGQYRDIENVRVFVETP